MFLPGGAGTLYHFSKNFSTIRRSHLPPEYANWIGTTAAQDAEGRVYAVYSESNSNYSRNVLVCFSRYGGFLWKYEPPMQLADGTRGPEFPAYLFGIPKVWSRGNKTIVFISFCFFPDTNTQVNYLLGLNEEGIPQGLGRFDSIIGELVGGGGLREVPGMRHPTRPRIPPITVRRNPPGHGHPRPPGGVTVQPSGGAEIHDSPRYLPKNFRMPEVSPCIFQDEKGANYPVIAVTDGYTRVCAFRWIDPGLKELWSFNTISEGSGLPYGFGSPALFPNGLLAIGGQSGKLYFLDPKTGDEIPDTPRLSEPLRTTPASFLRQIYAVGRAGGVYIIDSNGRVMKGIPNNSESVAAPLVTGNYVYVAHANGVSTYDLFLEKVIDYEIKNEGMGIASLAAAPDGTIYSCSLSKLYAFPAP